jgi:hypothetical protein
MHGAGQQRTAADDSANMSGANAAGEGISVEGRVIDNEVREIVSCFVLFFQPRRRRATNSECIR